MTTPASQPKTAVKPELIIVIVKADDGTSRAYMTGKGANAASISLFTVSGGMYGELEAEEIDVDTWAEMPRPAKAAYKELVG